MSAGVNLEVLVRPIHARDLLRVVQVERLSFPDPWTARQFAAVLKLEGVSGQVAGERACGFVLFRQTEPGGLVELLNLAVAPGDRRRGVGARLALTAANHGTVCRTSVRETNLPGQLFFRALGFRCVAINRGDYGRGEDGYVFERGAR